MRKHRTEVFNRMDQLKARADSSNDPAYKQGLMKSMLEHYKQWQPGSEWVPDDSELKFMLDVRKKYPDVWTAVTGVQVRDWDDEEGQKYSWAEIDKKAEREQNQSW